VQRLFSTFPEGWPGTALVFLRAVAAVPLLQNGFIGLTRATPPLLVTLQLVAAGTAALLLAGLWTPVAGVLMAIAEVYLAFSYPTDLWMHILLGTMGVALAMLGPGAWSVDARLFGRKRIQIPSR
jgi:putative oxidoreductase